MTDRLAVAEQISARSVVKHVSCRSPFFHTFLKCLKARNNCKYGYQYTCDGTTGDITGGHQHAVRLIGLSNDLIFGEILTRKLSFKINIHQISNDAFNIICFSSFSNQLANFFSLINFVDTFFRS